MGWHLLPLCYLITLYISAIFVMQATSRFPPSFVKWNLSSFVSATFCSRKIDNRKVLTFVIVFLFRYFSWEVIRRGYAGVELRRYENTAQDYVTNQANCLRSCRLNCRTLLSASLSRMCTQMTTKWGKSTHKFKKTSASNKALQLLELQLPVSLRFYIQFIILDEVVIYPILRKKPPHNEWHPKTEEGACCAEESYDLLLFIAFRGSPAVRAKDLCQGMDLPFSFLANSNLNATRWLCCSGPAVRVPNQTGFAFGHRLVNRLQTTSVANVPPSRSVTLPLIQQFESCFQISFVSSIFDWKTFCFISGKRIHFCSSLLSLPRCGAVLDGISWTRCIRHHYHCFHHQPMCFTMFSVISLVVFSTVTGKETIL